MSDDIGRIERTGATPLSDAARAGRSRDLAVVFFGSQMNYASLLIGALPLAFGLGIAQAATALVIGTLLGASGVGAMAVLGHRTGANNVMTSIAFFGTRGRVLGALIIQMIDLAYFAAGIWVGAPQLLAVLRGLGLPAGPVATEACIVACGVLVLIVALLGHATIVFYERIVAWIGLAVIALLLVCTIHAPPGHPAIPVPQGGGARAAAWVLAVSCAFGNAVSYAPFAGDYARYVAPGTKPGFVFLGAASGLFWGCMAGCGAGLAIACNVSHPGAVTTEMLRALPATLLAPLSLCALIANTCNGAMVVYNGILNLNALLVRWRQPAVAILFGAFGLAFGYLGLVVFQLAQAIMAICALVAMLVTPWLAINIVGFIKTRGRLDPGPLHDPDQQTGRYRYSNGFSLGAIASWGLAVTIGLPFCANGLIHGPLAAALGGMDISFVVSGIGAAILYAMIGRPDRISEGPA